MNRCVSLTVAGLALAAFVPAQDLLVRAKTIVLAPDAALTDGRMLVRAGKIAYVGNDIPAEAAGKATVVDYGDATIVPGFVLPPTTLGRERDLAEGALAFTPDLRAVEAFDPWQEELGKLPRLGVTSLMLSPSPRNIAGGLGACVKPGHKGGTVVAADTHVALSLTQAARNPERPPTSLMGAIDLLRTAFAAAKQGVQNGPDVVVLRQALQGSRRIAVHADAFVELTGALDLAKEFDFAPILIGARDAEKVFARLAPAKASVVLETLRPDAREAQLRLPTRLAEAGIAFAFQGRPEHARMSAVLAVRAGLDRRTALAALTRAPATMFGQEATVGTLRAGHAADFAVWTGDPLDLDAALVATWIDGVRVHGDAPKKAARPGPTAPAAATPTAAGER